MSDYDPLPYLTLREENVFRFLDRGMTQREIAELHGKSRERIRQIVEKVRRKLSNPEWHERMKKFQ